MEEVFDSESFTLRYDEETNSCVLSIKSYGDRDKFRTPMMHAVEIIRKHKSEDLIIEDACDAAELYGQISEVDLKWIKKSIIPRLSDSCCKHIYFVVDEGLAGTKCDDMPYCLFAERFKTDKVRSERFALMMIKNKCDSEVSSKVESMTREEALQYMDLPLNANDFAIDERFWVMSKQLRGDNSPEGKQRIADLSAAYDIATGRRDERVKKEEKRASERKLLGKTGDEWRTYFSYTWYKYLIGIILIVLAGNLIYDIVARPGYDSGYLSIGHFENESDYVEKFLTTRLGFKNPMVSVVDIVVPNDQGQMQQAYADQTASTLLMSCPNVLVFDEATMPYYFSELADVSTVYSYLRDNLSEDQFSKLRPIYMSEADAQEVMLEYYRISGDEMTLTEEDTDLSLYDDEPVMVGILLTDGDAINSLGYDNLWPDSEPSLVFSVYSQSMDYSDSEVIIMQLLRSVL
ncbi:MAG: hypothetical protein IJ757_02690 [Clostridiales bacterium]|nr:hypothetical protein [Clostridiales bacterium]